MNARHAARRLALGRGKLAQIGGHGIEAEHPGEPFRPFDPAIDSHQQRHCR